MSQASTPALDSGRPGVFVGWLIGERVLRTAASAIALAVVARHLAPAGFGALNLALILVGIAMPLAQFGLDSVVIRELVRDPTCAGKLLGTATILRGLFGGGCALLVFAVAQVSPALAASRAAIGPICFMLVVQAAETPDLWFRAEVKSWPAAVARTTAVVCGAVGKIVLALSGAGVLAFAWLTLSELVLFEAGLWLVYRREAHPRHGRWHWDRPAALALASEAGVFAIAATLGGIAFRVDQLCVAPLLGEVAAGQYFAAQRLIEVPTFVAASLSTALFPLIARDRHALEDGRFESVVALLASVAWITALGTTLLGSWIVTVFFGAAYQPAVNALIVRAWAMLPFFSSMARANVLAALRTPGPQLIAVLFGLAAQAVLSLVLIPRFGLIGAASSFLVTEMLNAWVLPLWMPALRPTLAPQLRGWLLPWQPKAWRRIIALLTGDGSATPAAAPQLGSES